MDETDDSASVRKLVTLPYKTDIVTNSDVFMLEHGYSSFPSEVARSLKKLLTLGHPYFL